MEDTGKRFNPAQLSAFCVAVLEKAEVPKEHAQMVADNLLSSNLRGVDTHGVTRLPIYVERVRQGLINGKAAGAIISESETTAAFDGQNGLGQVVGTYGMRKALEKAESMGVGMVTVNNSNHYGTAAFYAMMAL
ncbi:MAG: Ldh family oxidoreductase, partial [Chloroflexota bacterium]